MKRGAELDPNTAHVDPLAEYCKLCGWAGRRAHAKSGDAAAIAA
jgi:hypothetical protein